MQLQKHQRAGNGYDGVGIRDTPLARAEHQLDKLVRDYDVLSVNYQRVAAENTRLRGDLSRAEAAAYRAQQELAREIVLREINERREER